MRETRALAHLKRLYPQAHFQRIEGSFSGGLFDLNGCFNGVESWVEMKQVALPKTARGQLKPEVKLGQPAWERLRRAAGGRTFIALMVGQAFYLLPGYCISELGEGITQSRLEELRLNERSLFNK